MNRIVVGDAIEVNQANTFLIPADKALSLLPILRAEHFVEINFTSPLQSMVLLTQLPRLLRKDGMVKMAFADETVVKLLKQLGLHQRQGMVFSKNVIQEVKMQQKLPIGFQGEEQIINEEELLQNDGIKVQKKVKCAEKVKACANCNCGRKDQKAGDGNKVSLSKEELIEGINNGVPVGGCGKCQLGDSFRCSGCPYNGLPAFKAGDKLQLDNEGNVINTRVMI